ncbi:MAG: septum formation initiator family protein [Reichenbachiella sp.]|uniref:FtsB family cell division protein n=1 Tax=Reichenbachiella sp. TaxID=2184521 RepID=UPI0032655943
MYKAALIGLAPKYLSLFDPFIWHLELSFFILHDIKSGMLKKSLHITKNFYFIAGLAFLVWMLFFDTNDLYSQYQLRQKVRELESQETYYLQKIEEVNADREALTSDMELLERFAREKYYMKKDGEDLFVVVEE